MQHFYVLRELPGVADLEARLQRMEAHPNPLWAPEFDDLWDHVDRVSRCLFGVTEDQIGLVFEVDEAGAPWREFLMEQGWNVDGPDGKPLLAFQYLVTAVICAVSGKAGRLPDAPLSDQEAQERAEDWGSDLAEEARRFRNERPRRQ
jgi:hypothetical protein